MSIWAIVAILCAIVFGIVVIVPAHFLIPDFGWFALSWAFYLAATWFSGPKVAVPTVVRETPAA
jgi:hypothetical protein